MSVARERASPLKSTRSYKRLKENEEYTKAYSFEPSNASNSIMHSLCKF